MAEPQCFLDPELRIERCVPLWEYLETPPHLHLAIQGVHRYHRGAVGVSPLLSLILHANTWLIFPIIPSQSQQPQREPYHIQHHHPQRCTHRREPNVHICLHDPSRGVQLPPGEHHLLQLVPRDEREHESNRCDHRSRAVEYGHRRPHGVCELRRWIRVWRGTGSVELGQGDGIGAWIGRGSDDVVAVEKTPIERREGGEGEAGGRAASS